MLPTFIGIGAQRTGTTWIYHCLKEHPEVFVPEEKELNFFSQHYARGIEWYESHFQPEPQHKAVGEISPIYLADHAALQRLAAGISEALLFAVVRHPIDRAYSAYELHQERFPDGFRAACEHRPDYLIEWGFYARHLKRLYELYDQRLVRVLVYDDLEKEPQRFLASLLEFLNVDPNFAPSCIQTRFNRIMYPKTQGILRALGLSKCVDVAKNTTVGAWIRNRHARQGTDRFARVGRDDTEWLMEQFRPDIIELQDLLGRDLSSWLRLE